MKKIRILLMSLISMLATMTVSAQQNTEAIEYYVSEMTALLPINNGWFSTNEVTFNDKVLQLVNVFDENRITVDKLESIYKANLKKSLENMVFENGKEITNACKELADMGGTFRMTYTGDKSGKSLTVELTADELKDLVKLNEAPDDGMDDIRNGLRVWCNQHKFQLAYNNYTSRQHRDFYGNEMVIKYQIEDEETFPMKKVAKDEKEHRNYAAKMVKMLKQFNPEVYENLVKVGGSFRMRFIGFDTGQEFSVSLTPEEVKNIDQIKVKEKKGNIFTRMKTQMEIEKLRQEIHNRR